MDGDLIARDRRCVACGTMAGPFAGHHRILGNRADNRLSNRLLFCGTGNVPPGCHGLTHQFARLARDLGYIVTRHGTRAATLSVPVLYWQPALGPLPARIGWFLPDDDGRLSPVTGLTVPPEGLNPE